ncbi:hypothetical protein [Microbacterium sp. No. 7]|uniref:hypothetical protein n=1 Tax=Microbacterium sp. No. 7 TaxID=1714373 RepID=UPI0006D19922|nr:hypothetical protein [Microbacterium sp. No. 7]ALJ18799.1 hypothetical protein AOA12_02270 [Microbacterium sp. No. 7]
MGPTYAAIVIWLGAAAGAVFTLVLLHAGLWLVGIPLLVFTAAWSAVFLRRRITARAWPFALIQDRLTANGLARQAQRVHDARREWRAEPSSSRPCR